MNGLNSELTKGNDIFYNYTGEQNWAVELKTKVVIIGSKLFGHVKVFSPLGQIFWKFVLSFCMFYNSFIREEKKNSLL